MATEPLDIIKLLLPMITGSPKQVTSGATSQSISGSLSPVGSDAIANIMAILQPTAAGTNTAATDAIVQNILQKAAIAFAPTGAMENQAGLYNSSVRKMMMNDAMGRAVGESSAAVLKNQTDAQTNMVSLAKTLADATKSTATTAGESKATNTKPLVNPAISAAIGAALLGKSAFNQFGSLLGFGDKFKDPRLGDEGVLSQSPADAEAGLAGDQVASGAGGGPSISGGGGASALSSEGSLNSFDASTATALKFDPAAVDLATTDLAGTGGVASSGIAADTAAVTGAAGADEVAGVTFTNAAAAEPVADLTTTVVPDASSVAATNLLTPQLPGGAPTALDLSTPVSQLNMSPAGVGAGTATGNIPAGMENATMMSAENIPGLDTANRINQLADAGSISGTTTDVTAGMFDSAATASADSAFAIPEATSAAATTGGAAATSALTTSGLSAASVGSILAYPLMFALSDMFDKGDASGIGTPEGFDLSNAPGSKTSDDEVSRWMTAMQAPATAASSAG